MSLRLDRFRAFARERLPSPPARLLEIGCGDGELARALAADGYEVVAVDPNAPEGAAFRRVTFEDFGESGGFDGVVASLSLHHIERLDDAVDKIATLVRGSGALVVQEWAKERFVGDTARWYHVQRLARTSPEDAVPVNFEEWIRQSDVNLAHIYPWSEVERSLDRRFAPLALEWAPYLYSHHLDDAVEPEERALIATRSIVAKGVLYAGALRARPTDIGSAGEA